MVRFHIGGGFIVLGIGLIGLAAPAAAQSSRPTGRASFFVNSSRVIPNDGTATTSLNQVISSVTFEQNDGEGNGVEYAIDVRRSEFVSAPQGRNTRLSLYDAYAGGRVLGGRLRVRTGGMWLTELGGLGAIGGGLFEFRQKPTKSAVGRFRTGVFYGVEPTPFDLNYVPGVRKYGGYAVLEGAHGRKHSGGYVRLTDGPLVERSVITVMNFLPIKSRVFVYQAGEYDLVGPAGQGSGGLTYFFINGRVSATKRVDLQGDYHRGRSIDTRSITDDVLAGRPVQVAAVEGFLYESAGTRVTVEVIKRVRVNAGYTRDRNNRDSTSTGRITAGASASDIAHSGIDVTVSDSRTDQPTGRYGSLYFSLGRQFGRRLYLSSDYSSSLAIVNFTRSDGITVESRPSTRQVGTNAVVTAGRHISLLVTADRTLDDSSKEYRMLAGMTYRFR